MSHGTALRFAHNVNLWTALRWLLTAVTAAGLAYDAYVHADLAGTYDAVKTSAVSQGDLFRVEAGAAGLAALLVLFRPRRYTAGFAALVAGAGLAALLAYRYYNIGKIGPLPSMYEPAWYPEKTHTTIAQAIATAAAIALLVLLTLRRPHPHDKRPERSVRRHHVHT
jgi:hypothetical protein